MRGSGSESPEVIRVCKSQKVSAVFGVRTVLFEIYDKN